MDCFTPSWPGLSRPSRQGGQCAPKRDRRDKPGDRILFGKWSGTEVRIEGEDLLIMKESDILGIIETPAELKKAA